MNAIEPVQVELINGNWLSPIATYLSLLLSIGSLVWQTWTWGKDNIRILITSKIDYELGIEVDERILEQMNYSTAPSNVVLTFEAQNMSTTIPVIIQDLWLYTYSGKRLNTNYRDDCHAPYYDDIFFDDPENQIIQEFNSRERLLSPGKSFRICLFLDFVTELCISNTVNPKTVRITAVDHTNKKHDIKISKEVSELIKRRMHELSQRNAGNNQR
ncbi:MAG: hypothetical protein ABF489_02220 [Bifidobacterium sp.]|uniref:hypothetical protein n=1 Tax=Bifidobacterium sp. TaxID=41200 RepID=UPI0039EC6923